jgi:hypothetical protein
MGRPSQWAASSILRASSAFRYFGSTFGILGCRMTLEGSSSVALSRQEPEERSERPECGVLGVGLGADGQQLLSEVGGSYLKGMLAGEAEEVADPPRIQLRGLRGSGLPGKGALAEKPCLPLMGELRGRVLAQSTLHVFHDRAPHMPEYLASG